MIKPYAQLAKGGGGMAQCPPPPKYAPHDVISLVSTHSNYCEAIGRPMFENLFLSKRKDNKRFEKKWLVQNRLDA